MREVKGFDPARAWRFLRTSSGTESTRPARCSSTQRRTPVFGYVSAADGRPGPYGNLCINKELYLIVIYPNRLCDVNKSYVQGTLPRWLSAAAEESARCGEYPEERRPPTWTTSAVRGEPGFVVNFAAYRREASNANDAERGLMPWSSVRW